MERGLAARAKEGGEERAALVAEDAFDDFDAVVECGVVHHGENGAARSCFGIAGGEDEACDARMEYGSGTHGAGFKGAVEGAAGEAIVRERAAGFPEGDDFGMGGGVVGAEDLVVAAGDHVECRRDDDGADGDFTCGLGGVGFGDGEAHEVEVGGGGCHRY